MPGPSAARQLPSTIMGPPRQAAAVFGWWASSWPPATAPACRGWTRRVAGASRVRQLFGNCSFGWIAVPVQRCWPSGSAVPKQSLRGSPALIRAICGKAVQVASDFKLAHYPGKHPFRESYLSQCATSFSPQPSHERERESLESDPSAGAGPAGGGNGALGSACL